MSEASSSETLPWKSLASGRAVGFGDPLRVPRPEGLDRGGGERVAVMLHTAGRPVLVVGAPGTGKSSALAQAAGLMKKDHVSCLVPLDRLVDPRTLTADVALAQVAGQLATVALSIMRMKVGAELKASLVTAGVLNPKYTEDDQGPGEVLDGGELLRRTIRELRQIGRRGRAAIFVDGLERCGVEVAREVLHALIALGDECAAAATAPPELVTGPEAYALLSQVGIVPQRALPTLKEPGAPWQSARGYLRDVLARRLGVESLSPALASLSDLAAERSGGVPGVFLELLHAASGYAAVFERETPTTSDLDAACRDRADVMRCLLREGDTAALRAADGTSGTEVPLERRLRFLVQGLLLEYDVAGRVVVHPAPSLDLSSSARS
ncbi:MAG: ATP-binding protein [Polyangiales bacterium]